MYKLRFANYDHQIRLKGLFLRSQLVKCTPVTRLHTDHEYQNETHMYVFEQNHDKFYQHHDKFDQHHEKFDQHHDKSLVT